MRPVQTPVMTGSSQGVFAAGGTPAEFSRFVRADTDRWAQWVKETGIKAE